MTLCQVEGCEKSIKSKGYCSMHLERLRRAGELGPPGRKNRSGGAPEKTKILFY
jgi:hypothetical protein